jgi:hypothetical protein
MSYGCDHGRACISLLAALVHGPLRAHWAMAEDLTDLKIAVLCDLLESPHVDLKGHYSWFTEGLTRTI